MREQAYLWFYKTSLKLHLWRLKYTTETHDIDSDSGEVMVLLVAEPKWFWQR